MLRTRKLVPKNEESTENGKKITKTMQEEVTTFLAAGKQRDRRGYRP